VPIVGNLAATLQSAFGARLDLIGRQAGAIRRQRKFSGASLFNTIVLTILRTPKPQTDDFVATAARLGLKLTAVAIKKRFTGALIDFLRAGLEHLLKQALRTDSVATPLLARFAAVEIGDSTTVTVPDEYAAEFPGCGGKMESGKAAVKIQLVTDLRDGDFKALLVEPGRQSDARSRVNDRPVVPGSLSIHDLGYFSLERFRRRSDAGAYWISRLQQGTRVFDEQAAEIDLLDYAKRSQGDGPIEMQVQIGSQERLKCRVIVLRVPKEVADRRRQKAYEKAQKHGRVPSSEHLAWCEWTVLVTNCLEELLSWKEVVVLYRIRWQIELIFKLWKSHNGLAAYREEWTAVERMVLFWAKLIAVVLQNWLLLSSIWSNPKRSPWKAARVIRRSIVCLIGALKDLARLTEALQELFAEIEAVATQKRQKKRPSAFQLLNDPELLNWSP
jgi:Transposase DDE domain